jgi:hypothetical protein
MPNAEERAPVPWFVLSSANDKGPTPAGECIEGDPPSPSLIKGTLYSRIATPRFQLT